MPIVSDRLGDEDDLAKIDGLHFVTSPGKPAEEPAEDGAAESDAAWAARHQAAGWTTYYCGEPEDKLGPAPPDDDT